MIMACNIAGVSYGEFILHLAWLTVLAFSAGWFVLIRPIKAANSRTETIANDSQVRRIYGWRFRLSLSPLFL